MASTELRGAGTVSEVVSPVVRWRAKVGDEKRDGTCDGVFVVDSGEMSMKVTARGHDLRGESKREKMAWSELAARFNLALGAIPPFTEASVDILEISVGTEVAVVGEVTERELGADGGPRTAPTARPSALRATVIGIGDRADVLVDRELAELAREPAPKKRTLKKRRWHQRLLSSLESMTATDFADAFLLVIACVLLIVAGKIASGPTGIRAPIGFACGVVAFAVALRPGKQLEPFRAREKVHGRVMHLEAATRCVAFAFCVLPLALGLGIATGALPTGPDGARDGAPVIAMFGLSLIGALLIGEIVARPTVRRLAALAGRDGIEGMLRVQKPESLGGRAAALGRIEDWESYWYDSAKGRKSSERMKSARFASASKLTIETDNGKLDIDPAEVAWASTIKFRHEIGGGWQIIRLVPATERVVVHGMRDGTKLRSHGLSAVLLFGGPAAPRAWAARAVRWRYFTQAVLIASAAGLLWSSGWLG